MDIKIVVKKKLSAYEARAFDTDGKLIDSLVALSESNARRLLKEKLGLIKNQSPKNQKTKKCHLHYLIVRLEHARLFMVFYFKK